jgi:hypothetical protein
VAGSRYSCPMGMFDRIHLENEIPDPEFRDEEWQTKSLENMLLDYRVTREGELIVKRQEFERHVDSESRTGFVLKAVREWEEMVEHHGVVEAYAHQDLPDESTRVVTYFLYFTYGRLTSLERTERVLPPRKPLPRMEDGSPRVRKAFGELEVDLPVTIRILALEPEGKLSLLALGFDGYLHFRSSMSSGSIEIRGNSQADAGQTIVVSSGVVRHLHGAKIEILAESRSADEHLLVLAPGGYREEWQHRDSLRQVSAR